RLDTLERAKQIGTAHDTDELVVTKHRCSSLFAARDQSLQLADGRRLGRVGVVAAHDSSHRSVREIVPDRLVEILTAHPTDDSPTIDDEHATLSVPLAQGH